MEHPQSSVTGIDTREARQPYTWRDIFGLALKHKPRLVRANLLAIMATVMSVPVPLLLPVLVDEVLLDEPGPVLPVMDSILPGSWETPVVYIGLMVLAAFLLRVAALSFNVLQSREFSKVSKDVVFRIRSRLLGRLQRVAMSEYETRGSGGISSHFITDLDTVDQFLGTTISRFLVASLTVFGTALVLLWVHWQLALLILLFNPLVIFATILIGKRVKELKRRENSAYEEFQGDLTETLDAIHQLRAANREKHYLRQLIDRARNVRDHAIQFEWRSDAASRASFALFQFGVDAFRAAAMVTVLFSDLSIGMMFAIFGYLWFMLTPVQEMLNMQYAWFAANAALARINRLLDLKEEPRYPALENPFRDRHTVGLTLRNIHFAYGEEEVLRGINLELAPGEKVALVGASGGGKSTLIQVILGMYTPQQGEVLIDGVPVQRIGLPCLREHVATVLQHPALFNDTVRQNLTLGREKPDAELWEALRIAQLDATVAAMHDQLDTVIGRQGVRLSGGQRQRLAIARMILSDPSVVILDEATSALDAETEFQLHRDLEAFLKQRTTLIIAHRLSAVKQADRACVFEDGRIIEEGHHDELIAREGLYAQLYGERQM
ncbi:MULTISPECIES: ABC transporter ATP-binding protein [Marinobacter]|uniref:ABC transporter ATP-binding protein n=1 Tax=Marinobacter TaxID=2742 RepID=UPI001ADF0552|nr:MULTISPECIES: ABC transporter ATP-binding protein [Marinobacter]MBO6809706.1 ABC transporter ATP-binding protein [Marinobacter sp.]MBO6872458.1 ABC transporter ATP-binding protein [Marinobacter sp.]QTN42777.1 ABC transporter ATP-binding protein [Marinobacter salsuginis]